MLTKISKYYPVLSIILMLLSIVGGITLFRQSQDLRNLATPSCPTGKEAKACNRTCNGGCVDARCCNPDGSDCVNIPWENDSCCGGTTSASCQPGQCNNQTNRPEYECNGKNNCRCTSICYWQTGGTCNEGCNQLTCDNGDGCTISCDKNGGPGSCGTQTSPGGVNNNKDAGCPQSEPPPATGAKCPNDSSLTIKKYIKFVCPNGCPVTTEQGVTASRCYENRQDSSSPMSLNGACGQIDALSGDADSSFCGTTEYNCAGPCQAQPPANPTTPPPVPTATRTPTAVPTATRVPTATIRPTNTVVPTATRIPTATIRPTNTVVPTATRTPTATIRPTNTVVPTATRTPTATVIPTSTPRYLSCGTSSCNQSNTYCQSGLVCINVGNDSFKCSVPEYQGACISNPTTANCCQAPTPTNTIQPTATVRPTSTPVYIAKGPTPTRIILPNAGVDFPVKGLTIVGVIVTLLGLLVLL